MPSEVVHKQVHTITW